MFHLWLIHLWFMSCHLQVCIHNTNDWSSASICLVKKCIWVGYFAYKGSVPATCTPTDVYSIPYLSHALKPQQQITSKEPLREQLRSWQPWWQAVEAMVQQLDRRASAELVSQHPNPCLLNFRSAGQLQNGLQLFAGVSPRTISTIADIRDSIVTSSGGNWVDTGKWWTCWSETGSR